MKSMGIGQAHGKVIWMGEHAVVYGYKAMAIPLRSALVKATIKPSDETMIYSQVYQGHIDQANDDIYPIAVLIKKLMQQFENYGVTITIESQLPNDAGLGSSAATASAITAAFYDLYETKLTQDIRFDWIQLSETIAHNNPSGIDALITMLDTPIIYSKGNDPKPIWLNLDAYLVIGFSGIKGQTKKAVLSIAKTYEQAETKKHIDALGKHAEHVISYVGKERLDEIGMHMVMAHEHLKALGVSIQPMDDMIDQAMSLGAIGAKLTGGGLGGCVIALAEDLKKAQMIQTAWASMTQKETWILDLSKRKL